MEQISKDAEQILNKINDKIQEEQVKKPWDKVVGETNKAYTAFVIYLHMQSDRSLANVAKHLGKSKRNIEKWSTKFNWVERVTKFDEEHQKELIDKEIFQHHSKLSDLKQKAEDTASALHTITLIALGKLYSRLQNLSTEDVNAMDAVSAINSIKNVSIIATECLDSYARALGVGELMATVNLDITSSLAPDKPIRQEPKPVRRNNQNSSYSDIEDN